MCPLPFSSGFLWSIVRRSVRTKFRTEQVAEPSSDRAMRFHPSPEQRRPSTSLIRSAAGAHVALSVRGDLFQIIAGFLIGKIGP